MKIVITTFKFIVHYLAKELTDLGYKIIESSANTVTTEGNEKDVVILNYKLRTANQILVQIAEFEAENPNQLYKEVRAIKWDDYLWKNKYFSVASTGNNRYVHNFLYINQLCKDAIADFFYDKYGIRPNSGSSKHQAVIALHWDQNKVFLYLDTSGNTLAKHGYRKFPWKAPLLENLACAILLATEWKTNTPFVNPMCGSGTLCIEAALMALGRYPGFFRNNYSFMHLKAFSEQVWKETLIRLNIEMRETNDKKIKIIASDISPEAIKYAQKNARFAGVDKLINFKVCDFKDTKIPEEPGTIIFNPEYGNRMGNNIELYTTYQAIGNFLKKMCKGYNAFIFTGNLELAKQVGLRTHAKIPFYNGNIECRLLCYSIF